jgi:hypothetical protein
VNASRSALSARRRAGDEQPPVLGAGEGYATVYTAAEGGIHPTWCGGIKSTWLSGADILILPLSLATAPRCLICERVLQERALDEDFDARRGSPLGAAGSPTR